jgi:chemotaxis protein CheC
VPELELGAVDRAVLDRAILASLENAADGLSQMTGRSVRLRTLRVAVLGIDEIASELPPLGEPMVAVYLWLSSAMPAHIVLLLPPIRARELVDLLMDLPLGTTSQLDDMATSALGEVGNLMGGFFANSLSDLSGQIATLSTPVVIEDLLGAVMDGIISQLSLGHDVALLIETAIQQDNHDVDGLFLVLPDPAALRTFIDALRPGHV